MTAVALRTSDQTPLCAASADGAVRRRLAGALTAHGYRVVEAGSLEELTGRAGDGISLAIVDPRLPRLGDRPLSRLRAEPALHRCPLIVLNDEDVKILRGKRGEPDLVDLFIRVHAQLAGSRQLDLLHGVSRTLSASPDMEPTMRAVLAAVAEVLPFDTGTLFLLDRLGRLQARAAWGYEVADAGHVFGAGEGVVGWVVANRVPSIVGDSDLDERFASRDGGRSSRSMLAVPIMVGDRVLGALTLVRRAPADQFTDEELVLVGTIGNSAAIALENARLYEQERSLALRLEELNQLYGREEELLERLAEYDRLYTQVVATVSHELKTPLMGIRGFAQMIRDGDVDQAEGREFATEIVENAARLSNYAERILQEDAVHQGRMRLDLREVRLSPLVTQVLHSLRGAEATGHRLVNDIPEDLPAVRGDQDKIYQILLNLLNNAIKYSPGGGLVRVVARAVDREILLRIEDEGVGIPEEARNRVFDRFYRVERPETHGIAGTGLGLSIVRGLVELHGGRVWIEPRTPKGTRFCLTLPQAVYFPAPAEYANLGRGAAAALDAATNTAVPTRRVRKPVA
jgi:signal transduction histidine kinase